jgi:hypothetical protein
MHVFLATDAWGWTERISWLVIILGIGLTVSQLRVNATQLAEVAKDVRAHSVITMGFNEDPVFGSCTARAEAKFVSLSSGLSRTTLTFAILNSGNRTAREININYKFPEGTRFPEDENSKMGALLGGEPLRIRQIAGFGFIGVSKREYLHPQMTTVDTIVFDFPSDWSETDFSVIMSVTRSDSEPQRVTLTATPKRVEFLEEAVGTEHARRAQLATLSPRDLALNEKTQIQNDDASGSSRIRGLFEPGGKRHPADPPAPHSHPGHADGDDQDLAESRHR